MPDVVEIIIRTIDESTGANDKIVGSFTELNSAIAIGKQAIEMAGEAYDATVGKAMKYAQEVRDLSQISGQSAEDTSRFIQVLDDYQISAEDAMAATRALTRNGLAPNLETLAQLSDQYLALTSEQERNKLVIDNLGRAGLQWVNVLKQGGDAIREQGDAVSKGLILSQQQLDQAEKLRLAQDELNDSWTELTTNMGTAVIPVLADVIGHINNLNEADRQLAEEGIPYGTKAWYERRQELLRNIEAEEQATAASYHQKDAIDNIIPALEDQTQALEDLTQANEAQYQAMQNFQGIADEYNGKLEDLYKEHDKLLKEKQSLIDQGYGEEGKAIQDVNAKLDENIQKQGETAEAAQKAIKQRIVSMMEEAMMADKEFTPQEMNALLTLETQWGLMSDSAAKGAQNVYNAVQEYMATGDLDAFKRSVDDVGKSIIDLPDSKTITLEFQTTLNGDPMTPEEIQRLLEQTGG